MLKTGLILSAALLAGRLSGLLREISLASLFGLSPSADIAVLLLMVPDLFVNLLLSGGLSAALVPHMSTMPADAAMVLLRWSTLAVLGVFGALGGLLAAFPGQVFFLFAPGVALPFDAGAACVVAVALAIPLTGAAGVAGAFLNARQHFFVTGCGTLLFNAAVLAALWLALGRTQPLELLAAGIVGGAALRWGAQLLTLPRRWWRAAYRGPVADVALARAFGAAALATALMLAAPLLVRALASTLGSGAIASFNYAQKLVELPVGILITSISTVALARLSTLHAQEPAVFGREALRQSQYALLMAVAVTVLGVWFADALVATVFGYGQMDQAALARVTTLTRIALLGIPFAAISSMASTMLYASRRAPAVMLPTALALLILPLLCAPGLYWESEAALMGAVVVFQAIVAGALARRAGLALVGADAVVSALSARFLVLAAAAGLAAAALDHLLGLHSHWLRLLLAGAAFALAMIPVRAFLRTSRLPQCAV